MPVFRVEKTADFTVMSNHHLRNRQISLRAKGLLSQILSLPPDWDYTLAGLAAINLEGIDAVREAVKELEAAGYVAREQRRGEKGRFSRSDYVIREIPLKEVPASEKPTTEEPTTEGPTLAAPGTGPPTWENPTELSTKQVNREKLNTDGTKNPIYQITEQAKTADQMRRERGRYSQQIKENIDYEIIAGEELHREEIDEIIEIMLDAICSTKPLLVICGEEMSKEVVKSRLLKLGSEHIQYVLDCIRDNTTKVRNVKQYILACLYNAPSTMSSYYTTLVNHDLYGGTT